MSSFPPRIITPWINPQVYEIFLEEKELFIAKMDVQLDAIAKPDAVNRWLAALLSRKPARVVTVALANKAARVIWAIMARGGIYRAPQPAGAAVA
jgi:hypothetical protein